MTKQKSLKRLVRERMERTGESYTTAHRTITAKRPTRSEPGLIASYPGSGFATHRDSAMVQRLLDSAGIELSEPMVCGLGGGIGFMYAVFEYKSLSHPLLTFVTQHHPRPWIDEVTDNLGLGLSRATSSSAGAALKKLDAVLEEGKPALLTVGTAGLPWYEGVSAMEAYEPYTIVVAGRHEGEYLVDDCGESVERITAAALAEAWALHKKGKFAVQTVQVPEDGAKGITDALKAALRTTSAHMTGPVLGNSFDVNFGLSGIQKWADEVADTRTKKGWRARFSDQEAFRYAMDRLVECFTVAYGSPGATRPIFAEFLSEAHEATAYDLKQAASFAAASGALWEEVVAVADGVADTATEPEAAFASIAELAYRIGDAEARLAASLQEAITR